VWLPGPTRLVWAWFAALFALGTPAWGQAVNIDNLNGELELGVLIRRQTSNTTGRPERRFDENRFDEAIGIDFDGYSLSPKVLRFSLGGRFGLQQADRESNLGDLSSGDSAQPELRYVYRIERTESRKHPPFRRGLLSLRADVAGVEL